MNATRETITIALKAPSVFDFQRDGAPAQGWNFVSADRKRKFVCFDAKLVDAFEKAKLEDVERQYIVAPPSDPKKDPIIFEIPGIYEKKKGGGGARGPMLTDKQAALFSAINAFNALQLDPPGPYQGPTDVLMALADQFHAWLCGTPAAKEPSVRVPRATASTSHAGTPAKPTPAGVPAHPKAIARIRKLVEADPEWDVLDKIYAKYGVSTLEELTGEQAGEVETKLVERAQKAKEAAVNG